LVKYRHPSKNQSQALYSTFIALQIPLTPLPTYKL